MFSKNLHQQPSHLSIAKSEPKHPWDESFVFITAINLFKQLERKQPLKMLISVLVLPSSTMR